MTSHFWLPVSDGFSMVSPAAQLPFWSFFSFFGSPSPAGLQLAGCWELQISSSGSQKGAVCWARLLLLGGFLRVYVKKTGEMVALLPQLRTTKQKKSHTLPIAHSLPSLCPASLSSGTQPPHVEGLSF